jgi:hypothetical protein
MPLLGFPSNPTVGQTYTTANKIYTWNGVGWALSPSSPTTIANLTATIATITTSTNSTSTNTGGLIVKGGVGIGGNTNIGGDLNVAGTATVNGAQVITTATIAQYNTATLQIVSDHGNSTTNSIRILNTTASTTTTTGALTVVGGAGIGGNVNIGGILTVAGDPGDIHGVRNITAQTITATNGIYIASTTSSTSTTTGALVIKGGVGIGGDVNIEGVLSSESVKIHDAVMDSTLVLINNTSATIIDSYSANVYRSAKYLVQIDEQGLGAAANFQVIEILLLIDNSGNVYATEYGTLTTNGALGEFAAGLDGNNNVNLWFTPHQATQKEVVVLRTALAV